MSELDNEVVGIGGEIPLQLLEGFLILPFGNELSAVCECGKRTLTLEFPLQPALRQCLSARSRRRRRIQCHWQASETTLRPIPALLGVGRAEYRRLGAGSMGTTRPALAK